MPQSCNYEELGNHQEVFEELRSILDKMVWNFGIYHEDTVNSIEHLTIRALIECEEHDFGIDEEALEDGDIELIDIMYEILPESNEKSKYALEQYIQIGAEEIWGHND